MRPEISSPSEKSKVESHKEEDKANAVADEMSEDEKGDLNILKDNSPIDLNALKEQTGLRNKKWDEAIKGLTQNKIARVEKTDEGFFVTWLSLK